MIAKVDADQLRPQLDEVQAPARSSGWACQLASRVRSSPYYPALSHPVLRRILPGATASALGDGMSAVAIAWLALRLAPESSRGLLVGAAVRPTRCPERPGR